MAPIMFVSGFTELFRHYVACVHEIIQTLGQCPICRCTGVLCRCISTVMFRRRSSLLWVRKGHGQLWAYRMSVFECSALSRMDEEWHSHRTRHQGYLSVSIKGLWSGYNADFLLMKYRRALPKVWSSFSI